MYWSSGKISLTRAKPRFSRFQITVPRNEEWKLYLEICEKPCKYHGNFVIVEEWEPDVKMLLIVDLHPGWPKPWKGHPSIRCQNETHPFLIFFTSPVAWKHQILTWIDVSGYRIPCWCPKRSFLPLLFLHGRILIGPCS